MNRPRLAEPYRTNAESLPDSELYKAFTCCPSGQSGDKWCESHHSSLHRAYQHGLNSGLVPKDSSSELYQKFIDHLVDEYIVPGDSRYTAEKARNELNGLQNKFFPDGEYTEVHVLRTKDHKVEFDIGFVSVFDQADLDDFKSPDNTNITPKDWLSRMFNDGVLTHKGKKGFITSTERATFFACNWNFDTPPIHPISKTDLGFDTLDKHVHVCMSVASTSTIDIPEGEGHRSKDRIIKQPYIVFESDAKDPVIQKHFAGLMKVMSEYAPLVAIIDSGGKSIHYWFATGDTDKKTIGYFKEVGMKAGADASVLRDKSKYVRMPNVQPNEDGRRFQKLLYFDSRFTDPAVLPTWDREGLEVRVTATQSDEYYYFNRQYYCKDGRGNWEDNTDSQIIEHLGQQGFWTFKNEGEQMSQAEMRRYNIRHTNRVDFVFTRLAGYGQGLQVGDDGSRYLVQKPAVWPNLLAKVNPSQYEKSLSYFKRLFDEESYEVFMGWWASGVRAAYNNGAPKSDFSKHSQFLNIIGKGGTGKSLMLEKCMAPMFGGGMSSGEAMFASDSPFNSEMFTSSLLVLDDIKNMKSDKSSREEQGETIKHCTVGSVRNLHAKNKDKINIKTFWRVIRTMNPSQVDTLPLIDDPDVAEKVIVLRIRDDIEKWNRSKFEEFIQIWEDERDALFTYLVKHHEIPTIALPLDGDDSRFPVKSHIDAETKETLTFGSSSDGDLIRLLNKVFAHFDLSELPQDCLITDDDGNQFFGGNQADFKTLIKEYGAARKCPLADKFKSAHAFSLAIRACAEAGLVKSSKNSTMKNIKGKSSVFGFYFDNDEF